MPARVSQEAKNALAKVLAGASISRVSKKTGVSRSTIYRHLRLQGLLRDGQRVDPAAGKAEIPT